MAKHENGGSAEFYGECVCKNFMGAIERMMNRGSGASFTRKVKWKGYNFVRYDWVCVGKTLSANKGTVSMRGKGMK